MSEGNEWRVLLCLIRGNWLGPKDMVHTVTEPWLSLSLCSLPFIFFLLSLFWVLHFYSLLFISVSISASRHLPCFFSPFVLLSSSQITRKTVPKLRTCLCKSYKSQSIVYVSLSLALSHFVSLFVEVKLCCVPVCLWKSGRRQTLSATGFLSTLSQPATHTHLRCTNTHVPWQPCCSGGMWWLISLYGDDTSCNEQEKAGVLICVVWEARPCLCVCVLCSSLRMFVYVMLYICSSQC